MSVRGKVAVAIFRQTPFFLTVFTVALCSLIAGSARALANPKQGKQSKPSASAGSADASQQNQTPPADSRNPHLPRGKKLILKDGSVQLVREYQVMDEKVRFYNTERSQWEEMPAALVNWDATRQSEADQKKTDAALLSTVHKQEQARRIMPLDVDASLEAAPGVFIPPGEGLFVYDGKSVLRLTQAQANNKLDKGKVVEQVLVPIPIVPSRRNLSIPRPHAEVRVHNEQPEFYMRTADGREPNMVLIRTKVHGDSRLIENVDTYLQVISKTKRNEVTAERWQIANGVYRFTISGSLEPGEYVFTEIVKGEGTNLYVWDFGVDVGGKSSAAK
jgi:hypothetical protein